VPFRLLPSEPSPDAFPDFPAPDSPAFSLYPYLAPGQDEEEEEGAFSSLPFSPFGDVPAAYPRKQFMPSTSDDLSRSPARKSGRSRVPSLLLRDSLDEEDEDAYDGDDRTDFSSLTI
jgi:hypothetical protein